MSDMLIPLIIAATVAAFVWGIISVIGGANSGQRRKLHQRLSTEVSRADVAAMAKPLTIQLEVKGLPPAIARMGFIQRLHRKLMGIYPNTTVLKFLVIAASCSMGLFVVIFGVSASPVPAVVGGLVGWVAPFFVLNRKQAKHQQKIAQQLPEALDFLTRILRAGHSLTTGLQMMSDELPKPLSEEFRRAYDQHSLGQPLEEALKDMATRIESTDFAFFITAVLIQRQTGGDLSEVLKNISGMIRGRVRLQQHVKAKTAEGRFTGYVLVAFPAIMFMLSYVMNPGYAGVLLNSGEGRVLLGIAVGLQMLGLFAIRKITTVKV